MVLVVATVGFSAYQDYEAVRPEFQQGSSQVQAQAAPYGTSGATVSLNITIPNKGLYTLNVTLTCDHSNPEVVCTTASVSVPPGQQQVLRFVMKVLSVQAYQASNDHRINGTVIMALEPFASVTINTDLSGLVPGGGI